MQEFIKFYQDDIITNQKLNILGAIGPLKGIANISGAVYSLFSKPYQTGLNNGDIIGAAKGFGEGVGDLYTAVSHERSNIYKKVTKIRKYII